VTDRPGVARIDLGALQPQRGITFIRELHGPIPAGGPGPPGSVRVTCDPPRELSDLAYVLRAMADGLDLKAAELAT